MGGGGRCNQSGLKVSQQVAQGTPEAMWRCMKLVACCQVGGAAYPVVVTHTHTMSQAEAEKAKAQARAVVTGAVEAMSRLVAALVPLDLFSSVHVPLRLLRMALVRLDCRGRGRGRGQASDLARSRADAASSRRPFLLQRTKVGACVGHPWLVIQPRQ